MEHPVYNKIVKRCKLNQICTNGDSIFIKKEIFLVFFYKDIPYKKLCMGWLVAGIEPATLDQKRCGRKPSTLSTELLAGQSLKPPKILGWGSDFPVLQARFPTTLETNVFSS